MQELDERRVSEPRLGTLAFLFTDIAGSTQLWEQAPDAMTVALARHDTIVRTAVEASAGRVVKSTGDGLMVIFPTAAAGVRASLAAQRALGAEAWPESAPLRVRMGLHAGDAEQRGDDYFGPTINRTARIMAAGHGGQVLLSAAAAALAADDLPVDVELRDLGEHRLKDLGRPERVFQLVHPALRSDFPPLVTAERSTSNLPIQAAPFVGRRHELAEVERRLDDPAIRLLTLTGPGGTGKTSLAIRAAGQRVGRFRDGIAFVELATIRDTDALLIALGRVIGVGEARDRSLLEQLADALQDRQMLIVLDNFEQVTAAAGITTELLAACPDLRFLATSREPLHVRAEHIFAVPPMGLPEVARGQVTAAVAADAEAVQLFVDRARAVRPDFALDDGNAATVADICRRLDGLPLAIELAAARLRLFSPEALLDRLGSRLELRSSARDLPARQQTLRAAIDWSYDLLAPGEQRLFEALAAFADADVFAVEAVIGLLEAPARPDIDVVETLASLIEKSLIRQLEAPQGEPRLSMLETIRAYAADRLDQGPAGPSVRRAHAIHFADLAAGLRRDLAGPERDQAIATMSAEVGNLRIAWRYWIAEADLGRLTTLADSLLVLNEARGWYQDTVALTTGMLGVLAGTTSSPEIVSQEVALRMSLARALMATQGYTLEVAQSYAQALALFEGGAQDLRQHYSVLRGLASLYLLRMEFDQAVDLGRRIVAMAEAEDDLGMRIDGLLVVGSTLIMTSDLKGGLRDLETAIDLAQAGPATAVRSRQGNDPRVACLTTAAFSHWLLGHPDQAVDRAHSAIALAQRLDHPYTMAYARFHAGLLHHWLGQPEEVVEQAIRLLEIADEYEFRIWSAVGSCLLGTAETDLGRLETGLAEIRRGMADYQGLVSPPVFWPMLLYLEAGARGRAGDSTGALLPLGEAIALMGGPTSGATFMPELLILRGDLLRGSEADASRPAAEVEATYRSALAAGRSLGARISELRALTRLAAIGTTEASAADTDQLQDLLATFDEGLGTRDLTAARAVLSAGDGA